MDNIIVTVNTQQKGPQILCTIKEGEINTVIDRIVKDFQVSYGEEEVTKTEIVIDQKALHFYPTLFKSVQVDSSSSVDTYTIWIEFHKRSLGEIGDRLLRNILQ